MNHANDLKSPKQGVIDNIANCSINDSPISDKLSLYKLSPKKGCTVEIGPWDNRSLIKSYQHIVKEPERKVVRNVKSSGKRTSSICTKKSKIAKPQTQSSYNDTPISSMKYPLVPIVRQCTSFLDKYAIPTGRRSLNGDEQNILDYNTNSQEEDEPTLRTDLLMNDIDDDDHHNQQNEFKIELHNILDQIPPNKNQFSIQNFSLNNQRSITNNFYGNINGNGSYGYGGVYADIPEIDLETKTWDYNTKKLKNRSGSMRNDREILKLKGTVSNISPRRPFFPDNNDFINKKMNPLVKGKPEDGECMPLSLPLPLPPDNNERRNICGSNDLFTRVNANTNKYNTIGIEVDNQNHHHQQHQHQQYIQNKQHSKTVDARIAQETLKMFKKINMNNKSDLKSWFINLKGHSIFTSKGIIQKKIEMNKRPSKISNNHIKLNILPKSDPANGIIAFNTLLKGETNQKLNSSIDDSTVYVHNVIDKTSNLSSHHTRYNKDNSMHDLGQNDQKEDSTLLHMQTTTAITGVTAPIATATLATHNQFKHLNLTPNIENSKTDITFKRNILPNEFGVFNKDSLDEDNGGLKRLNNSQKECNLNQNLRNNSNTIRKNNKAIIRHRLGSYQLSENSKTFIPYSNVWVNTTAAYGGGFDKPLHSTKHLDKTLPEQIILKEILANTKTSLIRQKRQKMTGMAGKDISIGPGGSYVQPKCVNQQHQPTKIKIEGGRITMKSNNLSQENDKKRDIKLISDDTTTFKSNNNIIPYTTTNIQTIIRKI